MAAWRGVLPPKCAPASSLDGWLLLNSRPQASASDKEPLDVLMADRAPQLTILLVEDNHNDVAMIEVAVQHSGVDCRLDIVGDGADALDYMFGKGGYTHRDPACLPNLVLLDLDLPRMNGHEFLRQIRQADETRLVPVVVLSASAEEFDTVMAYDLGANGYVVKPLDGGSFVQTVASAVEYWLTVNEGPAAPDC